MEWQSSHLSPSLAACLRPHSILCCFTFFFVVLLLVFSSALCLPHCAHLPLVLLLARLPATHQPAFNLLQSHSSWCRRHERWYPVCLPQHNLRRFNSFLSSSCCNIHFALPRSMMGMMIHFNAASKTFCYFFYFLYRPHTLFALDGGWLLYVDRDTAIQAILGIVRAVIKCRRKEARSFQPQQITFRENLLFFTFGSQETETRRKRSPV